MLRIAIDEDESHNPVGQGEKAQAAPATEAPDDYGRRGTLPEAPPASPGPAVASSTSRASTSTRLAAKAKDLPASPSSSLDQAGTTEKRLPGQNLAPYVKTPVFVDYGTKLKIGRSTFINRYCCILDTPLDKVEIGDRCLIGPNFSIYAVSHPKGTSPPAHFHAFRYRAVLATVLRPVIPARAPGQLAVPSAESLARCWISCSSDRVNSLTLAGSPVFFALGIPPALRVHF
jgi:hypothetical protein